MEANSNFNCADVAAHLDDYLDQELTPQTIQRILLHQESCPDCQARCLRAYQEMAQLREWIQNLTMPDTLLRQLLAVIPEDIPAPPASCSHDHSSHGGTEGGRAAKA